MSVEKIIGEILDTDEAKAAMRCAIRPMVGGGIKRDAREEEWALAALKARIDEIVNKHEPANGLVEGDEVTVRAHGKFCHEVRGLYMVELDDGLRFAVEPGMLVRRRKE